LFQELNVKVTQTYKKLIFLRRERERKRERERERDYRIPSKFSPKLLVGQ
jgi:hypothetical protein